MDAAPDEPVSTLGIPMRLKGTRWLPYSHSAAVRTHHPSHHPARRGPPYLAAVCSDPLALAWVGCQYEAADRIELVAGCDLRQDILDECAHHDRHHHHHHHHFISPT